MFDEMFYEYDHSLVLAVLTRENGIGNIKCSDTGKDATTATESQSTSAQNPDQEFCEKKEFHPK